MGDLLLGSPNTQNTGNFMRNLFSQLLTDSFHEGGEFDDIENDEFDDEEEINDLQCHMMMINENESSMKMDYNLNLDVLPMSSLETESKQVQALNDPINENKNEDEFINQLINESINDLVKYQESVEKRKPAISFFQEPKQDLAGRQKQR